jgi:uncharacterized protein YbbC (DUF1343 family)
VEIADNLKSPFMTKQALIKTCFILLLIQLPPACTTSNSSRGQENIKPLMVETGLDVLVRNQFDILKGQRVGVITNHTGLSKDGRHIADLINRAADVKLAALFGPEHGARGAAAAGALVTSAIDSTTGVPIYSLYGKTLSPTKKVLTSLDVLVFDIQDVGARFYTYVYTMARGMEAAAAHGKSFIVLDRPNPIAGTHVEGPMLLEGFESFVGLYKLPIRHGMTVGELARMFQGEGWVHGADSLELHIVKMTGWKRDAWFDQTDLHWVPPSPSMKTLATATVYPGTCLIEGTNVSEGRGTDRPFETIGAPWIVGEKLANELNQLDLPGVKFEPIEFTPVAILPAVPQPKFKGQTCHGVFIKVFDRNAFQPVKTGVAIISTIKRLYPTQFAWTKTIDRLYGSDRLRTGVDAGLPLAELVRNYEKEVKDFWARRNKYLLYN